jgi:hypothetical protein
VSIAGRGAQKTVQTLPYGTYSFAGLDPGQYTVKVTYAGFAPFEKTISVGSGTTQLVSHAEAAAPVSVPPAAAHN